jgi:hypothetical protein
MSHSVHTAAKLLLEELKTSPGAANALPWVDASGRPYIRILIDPQFWQRYYDIPKSFEGFAVVVEKREVTTTRH